MPGLVKQPDGASSRGASRLRTRLATSARDRRKNPSSAIGTHPATCRVSHGHLDPGDIKFPELFQTTEQVRNARRELCQPPLAVPQANELGITDEQLRGYALSGISFEPPD